MYKLKIDFPRVIGLTYSDS